MIKQIPIKPFDPNGHQSIISWLREFEEQTKTVDLSEEWKLISIASYKKAFKKEPFDFYLEYLKGLTNWEELKGDLMLKYAGPEITYRQVPKKREQATHPLKLVRNS